MMSSVTVCVCCACFVVFVRDGKYVRKANETHGMRQAKLMWVVSGRGSTQNVYTLCVHVQHSSSITNCRAGRAVLLYITRRVRCEAIARAKHGEAVFKYNTERNKKKLERKKLEIL